MSETGDMAIEAASAQVRAVLQGNAPRPVVNAWFDEATFTASYVVHDPATRIAAIIDPVLDFDPASGRTSTQSADALIAHLNEHDLTLAWVLETHPHADHLSAAYYLQGGMGGQIAIGASITQVQKTFGELFGEGKDFARDGSQFDRLIADGDQLKIGRISLIALHVPGHTPADMAYLIGDALFVGDTMFMPDYGSARTDFPGGDAATLYRSVRRLMRLPDETRVFLCHDYKTASRDQFCWESDIGSERRTNIHLNEKVSEAEFVAMRRARDASLPVPKLILPSIQVNMRGGRLPGSPDGKPYLKIPLNRL